MPDEPGRLLGLVAEDECVIALQVADALADLGVATRTFDREADALTFLDTHHVDLAVLDCRLKDGVCLELARRLEVIRIPYLIHSGCGREATFLSGFRPVTWVSKPSADGAIEKGLEAVLARLHARFSQH